MITLTPEQLKDFLRRAHEGETPEELMELIVVEAFQAVPQFIRNPLSTPPTFKAYSA